MKTAFLWLSFLMLATAVRTACALPLYEPFNYAAGATLSGHTNSVGFICGFNNTLGSQGTQPTVVGARLFVRSAAGGFNLGLGKAPTNNTLQVVWDTESRGVGTNIFVVACYRFLGSPNSVDDE